MPHIVPITQRRMTTPSPAPSPISAPLLLATEGTTEVVDGAGLDLSGVEVPEVTDADVDIKSVEDTEEGDADDNVEVVVKGRMRTAAPGTILRDVPFDVQAVVFAGPHHHDIGPSVEPLFGQAQGKTKSSKQSILTLSYFPFICVRCRV
jgi:hypothetical protein